MRTDIIFTHEAWQKESLVSFIDLHLLKNGHPKSPPFADSKGKIFAEINHGRWIGNCPTPGCNGALVVSHETPYFMCPYCRNFSNGGKWYEVKFPNEKKDIETLLLRRPAWDGFAAKNRNWKVGETIADLGKENTDRGIK